MDRDAGLGIRQTATGAVSRGSVDLGPVAHWWALATGKVNVTREGDTVRPPIEALFVPAVLTGSIVLDLVHPHVWPPTPHLPENSYSLAYIPPTYSISSNTTGGTAAGTAPD